MGFSLKRMFKNPFGSHSVFGQVKRVAASPLGLALGVVPGGGLVRHFLTAGETVQRAIAPALPVLHAAMTPAAPAMPSAMPGGAPISGQAVPTHRAHRAASRGVRRASRRRAAAPVRRASRKGRKLKFGSPAWRKRYMKPKRRR